MYIIQGKTSPRHSPRKRLRLQSPRGMSSLLGRKSRFAGDDDDDVETPIGCWGKSRKSKRNMDIYFLSAKSPVKGRRLDCSSEKVLPALTSEVEAISEQQSKTSLRLKRLRPFRRMPSHCGMVSDFPDSSGDDVELPQGHWDKKKKSKSKNDITVLSIDKPVKEMRLDANSERQLPALTPKMEAAVDSALACMSADQVLCEGFNISLTCEDLKILHGEEWLSDQIISFYLSLIVERSQRRRFPSVFAFNTFFFMKLLSGRHAALQRWTRRVDLFSYDIVLIPVHKKKGHWCLAIIDFRSKRILYYDPMKRTNYTCLYALRDYLKDESLDKKNTVFDMSSWKYEHVKNVPTQESDNDCGVFVLKYAEYYCRDVDVNFTQEDVQYFRRCMVYELLVKKLL